MAATSLALRSSSNPSCLRSPQRIGIDLEPNGERVERPSIPDKQTYRKEELARRHKPKHVRRLPEHYRSRLDRHDVLLRCGSVPFCCFGGHTRLC